jgi:cob(I)alamin adenosyltransferase
MNRQAVIQVYFGNGKGKTTAAAGLMLRSLNYGFKVLFAGFLKTRKWPSGERLLLKKFRSCKVLESSYSHPVFYPEKSRPLKTTVSRDQSALLKKIVLTIKKYDLVVLDEILNALQGGFLSRKEVEGLLDSRPEWTEIVMTGRPLPGWIRSRADLITQFKEVKHPFHKGMPARQGIEY